MVSRRGSALLLLLLAAVVLSTPLLASDTCEGSCGSHCGDCASCPLFAELHAPAASVGLVSATLPPVPESDSQPACSRVLDHVPLLGR